MVPLSTAEPRFFGSAAGPKLLGDQFNPRLTIFEQRCRHWLHACGCARGPARGGSASKSRIRWHKDRGGRTTSASCCASCGSRPRTASCSVWWSTKVANSSPISRIAKAVSS
jgi:hypothetical protein